MGALIGGGNNKQNAPIIYSGLNIGSSMMDLPIPIFWGQRRLSTNAIWYNNFQKHALSSKGKGAGLKGSKQYDYTAAVILGLCEGTIDSIARIWAAGSTTTTTTLAALNMTLFTGTAAQSPWSYAVSNYPLEARAYAYTTYLACPKLDLGAAASIPDNEFECVRANGFSYTHSTPGWINPNTHVQDTAIDCLMSDIFNDFLTNPQYGMGGFVSGDMGDMTAFATYQRAQGLFFSPKLNAAETATSIIDRWASLSNSWIYWDGMQFRYVPLGDSAVTGNGVTYTPDNAVAYTLTLNDFADKAVPVKVSRKDPADCYNRTVVSINDRTIGYVTNPIEYKDQTLVDQYGLRDNSSTQADEICDPIVGAIVAQLLGKRAAYIRDTYTFKTNYRFIRCLPGTVLVVPDKNMGINVRVRVQTVEEDEAGNLSFVAEEFPGNVGTYFPVSSSAAVAPTFPNQMVDPGNVNTPAIVEPSSDFTGGAPIIVVAASGGPNWGGCDVNISFDGATYTPIGKINAAAIQGVLTSGLANHADPDTVDTLAVDCTESLGVPSPVTHADADALRTLSLVVAQPTVVAGIAVVPNNGELLSFGNVAATGSYAANLTYLRRGQYGSAPAAHSTGDQFTVLDVLGQTETAVRYELPPQYIGQTIYLKLTSFNGLGGPSQDPSVVVEYQYTPTGAGFGAGANGVPLTPTGLAAAPSNGQNLLTWNANSATDNVTAYSLYAAPGLSQPFGSASVIWTGLSETFTYSGIGNGAAYTYFLVAANAVGSSGHTAGVNCTSNAAGIGTVVSVALAAPAEFTVSGSPVTASGTITIGKANQSANQVYAGPVSGGVTAPVFRALVSADMPASGAGSGTVTSVALTVPGALLGISGSPITASGTLAISLNTQTANLVFAGPTSGGAATPTFRSLGLTDLPLVGSANGLATLDAGGKLTSSQIPASLVGAVVYQGTWNANTNSPALASGVGTKGFYYKVSVAGTTSIDGVAVWNVGDSIIFDGTVWDKIDGTTDEVITVFGRYGTVTAQTGDYSFSQISGSVAASQLPNPGASSLGGVQSIAAVAHKFLTSISTSGVPAAAQPDFSDLTGQVSAAQALRQSLTKSADYTVVAADFDATLLLSGTHTLALTAAATLAAGFKFRVKNTGTGVWTIDPNASETIDGALTTTVAPGESFDVECDGTSFQSLNRPGIVMISSGTVSSAASQVIALPAGWETYVLEFSQMQPVNGGDHAIATFSTDGGSTYNSTDNLWGYSSFDAGSTNTNANGGGATTSLRILPNMPANVLGSSFALEMPWPWNTSNYKEMRWTSQTRDNTSGQYTRYQGVGALQVLGSAITHVKIAQSTGNIFTARYALYGKRGNG